MLSLTKRLENLHPCRALAQQLRSAATYAASSSSYPPRRRSRSSPMKLKKSDDKSEWWAVDGEMHEIGDNVPLRERFIIPRDNIPNKRRKQLREQFMRRTRLVLKESEHEPWCKKYMELYQELRENWERLYWDEGYSKKLAQDHANYESAEDDDQDFSPYRVPHGGETSAERFNFVRRQSYPEQMKDQGLLRNRQDDTWNKVGQIRDKFEYDREKRMQQKAFAPMKREMASEFDNSGFSNQPFNTQRYFPQTERSR